MNSYEELLNADMIDFMLFVQDLSFSQLNHLENMILINYNIASNLNNDLYVLEYKYEQYIKILRYYKSKNGIDLSIFSSSGS